MKGSYMSRLTAEKRNNLKRLADCPDREIDLSDIPEIRELPSNAVIADLQGALERARRSLAAEAEKIPST
jgi:hypothetical protein